jgi:hypothetical protein
MQIIIAAEAEAKPLSEHHYLVSFLTLSDTANCLTLTILFGNIKSPFANLFSNNLQKLNTKAMLTD